MQQIGAELAFEIATGLQTDADWSWDACQQTAWANAAAPNLQVLVSLGCRSCTVAHGQGRRTAVQACAARLLRTTTQDLTGGLGCPWRVRLLLRVCLTCQGVHAVLKPYRSGLAGIFLGTGSLHGPIQGVDPCLPNVILS